MGLHRIGSLGQMDTQTSCYTALRILEAVTRRIAPLFDVEVHIQTVVFLLNLFAFVGHTIFFLRKALGWNNANRVAALMFCSFAVRCLWQFLNDSCVYTAIGS